MNLPLKLAIVESRTPAYHIAAKLGITDSRLSKIIIGILKARESEKKALSEILGKPESELFPKESGE